MVYPRSIDLARDHGTCQELANRVTDRLRLRRPTERNIPALVAIGGDPLANQHSPTGPPGREESEQTVWGRGFAGEAAREALAAPLERDRSRPVVVRTRPNNAAAQRLAQRIGMSRRSELDSDGFITFASD